MNPIVSIITPSFNRAQVIRETGLSIFNQTNPNWEWVIVDDGSTDESWEVLQEFAGKDQRVKIFQRSRDPKGACTCRNIAIENSTGDYLIFLDSDDLMASFCIEQRLKAIKNKPETDFIVFPMLLFNHKPDDLKLLWNIETEDDDLARILRSDPICQGTGTIWKKESFINIGMWREDLAVWQDIELHIRSLVNRLKYECRMDLHPDVFIRISEVSLSRTGFYSIAKVKSRASVFEYTLKNLSDGDIKDEVKEALKIMGFTLVSEAIKSGHFDEAKKLIKNCESYHLLRKEESRQFKIYLFFRKYKGYKIPIAEKYFFRKIDDLIPKVPSTLGKVRYEKAIGELF